MQCDFSEGRRFLVQYYRTFQSFLVASKKMFQHSFVPQKSVKIIRFLYEFFHSLVMTRKNPVYISSAKRGWIRRKIKTGISKNQIALELHVSPSTVYYWTTDVPSRNIGWPGIRGKTLDMLQELIIKGYVFAKCSNPQNRYMHLHKYFPTIHRIKIYNQHILYLEGREDVAARAFIDSLIHKRIISYQELKQITKVFGTNLSRSEKEAFLLKKGGKRRAKIRGVQKEGSLPKESDSFSHFCIRSYC